MMFLSFLGLWLQCVSIITGASFTALLVLLAEEKEAVR